MKRSECEDRFRTEAIPRIDTMNGVVDVFALRL